MSNDNMNKDKSDTKTGHGTIPAGSAASSDKQAGVTSKMQAVKSAWDKAPEGAKKAAALKYYQSAEQAQKTGNDAEAFRQLEEATRALK
jgi:hypothetical protein